MNYNTPEYTRSNGATAISAITAYNAGATGSGITVAVIDSGVNPGLSELTGRISPLSQDVSGTRGVGDDEGHGTSIAGVIAANRDNSGIQGIAFNSTILALRTDDPGSCATTDGCSHSDSNIARAVDLANADGAKVINISLGGSPASTPLRNAIQRATRNGIIVVISAGNDGTDQPDPLAQLAETNSVSNGLIIIAGAVAANSDGTVDARSQLADFSDKAGSGANFYLSALGVRVRSFDQTGAAFLFSGTSYSAPEVAGAVALLESAFPNLTAAQVVSLLYSTAFDAGATGVDAIYGRGILSLANAFKPQGSTALAGSAVPVSTTDNGALGGAFGDGGQTGRALKGAVILDSYGRAFSLDLARTIATSPETRVLANLADRSYSRGGGGAAQSYSVTITPATSSRPWVGLAQAGLDNHADDHDRPIMGLVSSQLGRDGVVGAAFGYAPQQLAAAVGGGWSDGGFLAAGRMGFDAGLTTRDGSALAYARRAGRWMLSFSAGHATVDDNRPGLRDAGTADTAAVRAERGFGRLHLAGGLSQLAESETLLGSRAAGLGLNGATTRFATLEGRFDIAGGWTLSANARRGWTDARLSAGLIDSIDTIRSSSFDATLTKTQILGGDRLSFRVAQPLRVDRANALFAVPVSYDYATLSAGFEDRAASLAPSGRELDAEALYGIRLFGGDLDAHLFWRRDPGNVATRDPDVGAALRFVWGL